MSMAVCFDAIYQLSHAAAGLVIGRLRNLYSTPDEVARCCVLEKDI